MGFENGRRVTVSVHCVVQELGYHALGFPLVWRLISMHAAWAIVISRAQGVLQTIVRLYGAKTSGVCGALACTYLVWAGDVRDAEVMCG